MDDEDRNNGAITDARDQRGRFTQGNPGRPKGARHKLSESLIKALQTDFAANGEEAIEKVRKDDPGAYLRVIASLVPKELDLGGEIGLRIRAVDLTDDELAAVIAGGDETDG